MISKKHGKSTSKAEVLGVSSNGLWILVLDKEYFLPYKDFPWFKKANVEEVFNLILLKKKYLQWPELDVDLELNSLENLEQYPLIAS